MVMPHSQTINSIRMPVEIHHTSEHPSAAHQHLMPPHMRQVILQICERAQADVAIAAGESVYHVISEIMPRGSDF